MPTGFIRMISLYTPAPTRFVLLALALAALSACNEQHAASPEAVITVAKQMVADNRAEQLYTLIYTESEREKRVLREVGSLLGHLQKLAQAVNKAFPEEVAQLRKQAEEAASNGQASSMVASCEEPALALGPLFPLSFLLFLMSGTQCLAPFLACSSR